MPSDDQAATFTYKTVGDAAILLDLYPPSSSEASSEADVELSPVVIYFHGGGLTVGTAKSWFPKWLKERVTAAGFVFISAEYRLIPPSTAHDIVEDLRDLFKFLSTKLNDQVRSTHPGLLIDVNRVAVTGSSAGGLCAYLCAMHVQPKPRAVVGLYAMGGDLLTPFYFKPKSEVFYRGREVLDPQAYSEFLHPEYLKLKPTARSELDYCPADAPIPGFPANPRMLLCRLYLQLGHWLDYYTGEHNFSLSSALLDAYTREGKSDTRFRGLLPQEHVTVFPQFGVDESWPPTFLAHGSEDSAVLVEESRNMHQLLQESGVHCTLRIVDGAEHSLDYVPEAEKVYGVPGGLFDEIRDFLVLTLRPIPN